MPKYRKGPIPTRGCETGDETLWYPEGETSGFEVFIGEYSASEDQPTGLLAADGSMIWRCAERVGFDLGGE